jgi:hypothetical protein
MCNQILDFESGRLVLKATGTKEEHKIGSTPNQRLGILRRGPLFELAEISNRAASASGQQKSTE